MSQHSPEPWNLATHEPRYEGDGRDALCWIESAEEYFVAETEYASRAEGQARADARRIVACVNFCRRIPTETLEQLVEKHIGAAMFIQWVRQNSTLQETEAWGPGRDATFDVCIECSGVVHPDAESGGHADDCLMKTALDLTTEVGR